MMAQVMISRIQLMILGFFGFYNSEKLFLDKEIGLSYDQLRLLIRELHEAASKSDFGRWIGTYNSIKISLRRIFKSLDYIVNVPDLTLNHFDINKSKEVSEKYPSIRPFLLFLTRLHEALFVVITEGIKIL